MIEGSVLMRAALPYIGTLAIILGLFMIIFHILAIANFKIGEYCWSGENKILGKRQKIYSIIFISLLILMTPVLIFTSYLPHNGFPFTVFIWLSLIPLGYYTVLFIQMPKNAKVLNMIWGFLYSMSLLFIGLYY